MISAGLDAGSVRNENSSLAKKRKFEQRGMPMTGAKILESIFCPIGFVS
jgi:hypothetical protein